MSDTVTPGGRTAAKRDASRPFVLGRAAMERISEMEGLFMRPEIRADFEAFDAAGLTNEQRRLVIREKYGKPSR